MTHFSSVGGGIHHAAYIGGPPEHRNWHPGLPCFAPQVHDSARIEAFATVDAGMHSPTRVGRASWLMKHVHVGHDAEVGAECELAPGAVICGHVILADNVKVGVNACVLPFVRVGKGARIGSGAVVTKDVAEGAVMVGNPARPLAYKPAEEQKVTSLLAWLADNT